MGILTDTFIASEAELSALSPGVGGPAALFPTVQAKRMDPVKLATLAAIIEQRVPAALPQVEDDDFVRDWGEQWVYRFPEPLASGLDRLQPGGIRQAAAAWAATEEWRRDGNASASRENLEAITVLVGGLCRLARQAQREGKALYLWICL